MSEKSALHDHRYHDKWKFHGWTTRVTVLEEPRLFSRLFPELRKDDHERLALAYAAYARTLQRNWIASVEKAERRYGVLGPMISGGLREHWPRSTKDRIGMLAHHEGEMYRAAEAHWRASGKRSVPPWRSALVAPAGTRPSDEDRERRGRR